VQNLQGKQRRPKHSDDLLCPDPNRGVLLLSEHERGCSLSPVQQAQSTTSLQRGGSPISSLIYFFGFNTADVAIDLKKIHLTAPT
jgi:hypothetical protein